MELGARGKRMGGMTPTIETAAPASRKPLRLWPGAAAAVLLVLARFVLPWVVPGSGGTAVIGGLIGALLIIVWWLFFSRAPWVERLAAILLIAVAAAVTTRLVHPSVANGMMGMMPVIFGLPLLTLGLVAWAAASRGFPPVQRRISMAVAIAIACVPMPLIRTNGVTGDGGSDLAWRWAPTAEQRLLAQVRDEPLASAAPGPVAPVGAAAAVDGSASRPDASTAAAGPVEAATPAAPSKPAMAADWPGFRGSRRDGIIRGVRIDTNWAATPPVALWRRPIGPGWSSFAVSGDLLYTQEQRGNDEIVGCYRVTTGEPVWRHQDAARFWESNAGAGPRGTPTLSNGRVYTFGATAILNALDARTGAVVWSRNAASDHGVETPGWGFSSSPLVAGDVVIVATSGVLAAYDLATGEPRWVGRAAGGGSYSSPHLATIDGVAQVLLMAGGGARSVMPGDGKLLWEHPWPGAPIVQPALLADGDLLISTAGMSGALGIRRLAVAHGPGGWTVTERWTSNALKPYFNDLVVHEGHAYGFDGFILASVDLADGKRKWKGGRYGNGQLVLLRDQDILLVLSEDGELALVSATPDKFTEIARIPAIEGKTWNHPVLAGEVLLVRNGQEMAAFRLPLAGRTLKQD